MKRLRTVNRRGKQAEQRDADRRAAGREGEKKAPPRKDSPSPKKAPSQKKAKG